MTTDLDFATSLARQAGDIMRDHFRMGAAHRRKDDGTPVTDADEAINQLVIEQVTDRYPDHGVIGEEGSTPPGTSGRLWVCDPIDGTLPFTLGIPTNMFSIALVDDGVPILGVLYDPYLDRMYQAEIGRGAYVNGTPLHVNDSALAGTIVSVPTAQFGLTDNAALVADIISLGSRVYSVACITYVGALVAAGQISALVFPADTVWDIAALKVVVEEAGGMVTDIDGHPQAYDQSIRGAIASNGRVHAELVDMVQRRLL